MAQTQTAQGFTASEILEDLQLLLGRTADEWNANEPFLSKYGQKTIGRAYQIADVAAFAAQLRAEKPDADLDYGVLRWADKFAAAH